MRPTRRRVRDPRSFTELLEYLKDKAKSAYDRSVRNESDCDAIAAADCRGQAYAFGKCAELLTEILTYAQIEALTPSSGESRDTSASERPWVISDQQLITAGLQELILKRNIERVAPWDANDAPAVQDQ